MHVMPIFSSTAHWKNLLHYTELSTDNRVITDIWNANSFSTERFFNSKNRLALGLSTDGVAIFKSSLISMWPVCITVLNLPPRIRMNAENILLAGLWVGPQKPSMKLLLDPVIQDLNNLHTHGLTVTLPNGPVNFKVKLVLATFDLPAKASVLNCKQFNGKFGCTVMRLPEFIFPLHIMSAHMQR